MKNTSFIIFLLLSIFCTAVKGSDTEDTLHVISHNKTLMQTNPKHGFNNYPARVLFPEKKISYRKVILQVTLQCPDNLMCGEWDYSDGIYLIPSLNEWCKTDTFEIGRILTPYGRFYDSQWKFTFSADITDFASFLHDSATVIYKHTGYEAADDRGWKITIDFTMITGTPIADFIGILPLWNGNFTYGDSSRSIENDLHAFEVKDIKKTGNAHLWIIQTGHGMDAKENCAEFCYKYRDVLFDKKIVDHRLIKKECASNPLYHQAGTWIYDRANWCPGDMVQPECYNYPTQKSKLLEVDINMQPYVVDSGKTTACYSFSSFLFRYAKPKEKHDATLEKILVPSSDDMYRHNNPAVDHTKILIRNNGSELLNSLQIKYGFRDEVEKTHQWKGALKFGETEIITVPGAIASEKNSSVFMVSLDKPNGKKDAYPADNSAVSLVLHVPVFPKKLILSYKTNNDTAQTAWGITNSEGLQLFAKKAEELKPNTVYADTLLLKPGAYTLVVSDTAGDGLEFWANPEGGLGYFRIISMDGRIVKLFQPDFGNEIIQAFRVSDDDTKAEYENEDQVFAYPQRTQGKTQLFLLLNIAANVSIKISTGEKILLERNIGEVKEHTEDFDLTPFGTGIYQMEVIWGGQSKKIRIKIPEKK
jgi:hypothetical protein